MEQAWIPVILIEGEWPGEPSKHKCWHWTIWHKNKLVLNLATEILTFIVSGIIQ